MEHVASDETDVTDAREPPGPPSAAPRRPNEDERRTHAGGDTSTPSASGSRLGIATSSLPPGVGARVVRPRRWSAGEITPAASDCVPRVEGEREPAARDSPSTPPSHADEVKDPLPSSTPVSPVAEMCAMMPLAAAIAAGHSMPTASAHLLKACADCEISRPCSAERK